MQLITMMLLAALARPDAAMHAPAGTNPRDDLSRPFKLDPALLYLRIGVDGKPADVECDEKVAAPLCPVLAKAVSGWAFTPGLRNGVPASRCPSC